MQGFIQREGEVGERTSPLSEVPAKLKLPKIKFLSSLSHT